MEEGAGRVGGRTTDVGKKEREKEGSFLCNQLTLRNADHLWFRSSTDKRHTGPWLQRGCNPAFMAGT